jgi:hypothetical protein
MQITYASPSQCRNSASDGFYAGDGLRGNVPFGLGIASTPGRPLHAF